VNLVWDLHHNQQGNEGSISITTGVQSGERDGRRREGSRIFLQFQAKALCSSAFVRKKTVTSLEAS
jgi:hypothetical protein